MTSAKDDQDHPSEALEGGRVLDVAEPVRTFISRILGDLGADVIKIEPATGDPGHYLFPFATADEERLSLPFVRANLNKRSIIVDLDQREDQERFRMLAAQADVVEGASVWINWHGKPKSALSW